MTRPRSPSATTITLDLYPPASTALDDLAELAGVTRARAASEVLAKALGAGMDRPKRGRPRKLAGVVDSKATRQP